MKTVWVFPGQGSQAVNMGMDLLEIGQEKLAQAQKILGWAIADRCQGDLAELSQTQYTQPCLYVISAILADLLKAQGQIPTIVTGHSLGEYTALYCAGVFDFATGLELVKQRSLLMAGVSGGGMKALMGFDRPSLEQVIANTDGVVLANDNGVDQVVISGTLAALESVCTQIKIKRAISLPVSGAFHSPMMASVAAKFADILANVEFNPAQIEVLSNVAPQHPTTSGTELRDRLSQQMTSPVRWREICLYLESINFERAVEIGSGKVLTGLIKRNAPSLKLVNVSNLAQVYEF